jgi:hypothetical protein
MFCSARQAGTAKGHCSYSLTIFAAACIVLRRLSDIRVFLRQVPADEGRNEQICDSAKP